MRTALSIPSLRSFGSLTLLAGALALPLGACVAEDPPAGESDPAAMITGPVTETAIAVDETGAHVVSEREISVEEQRAELAAQTAETDGIHRAALASKDPACESASLWVYDQTNYLGNRVCFKRTGDLGGYVDLNKVGHICSYIPAYPRPIISCDTWKNKVRSYIGGSDDGFFIGFHEWTGTGYEHFAAWAAGVPVAGCYADNAHTVAIEPLLK